MRYKPQVSNYGLIHYWPFADSFRDIIGGYDITTISNGLLSIDRYGNKISGKIASEK